MSAPQSVPPVPFTAKALYNFVGNHEDELQFKKGDLVTVLQVVDGGWWEGQLQIPGAAQGTGPIGWFPANHIKVVSVDVNNAQHGKESSLSQQQPNASHNLQPSRDQTTKNAAADQKPGKVSHYSLGLYSLLESQLKFEESLNNLLEKSLIPLGNSNILSAKDYDILCCNLHEVTQLVKALTKDLAEACKVASNQQKFGKQFCTFLSRYRNLLLVYCANHPAAVRVISNHSAQLDSFAKASRSSLGASSALIASSTSASGFTGTILDLTAAYSQPFRQIETYSGILREIKATISDAHPDYNQITEAIRMADNLVNELDEVRSLKEKELDILCARIDNWPLSSTGNDPTSHLLALGTVLQMAPVWTHRSQGQGFVECYMLMFADYLVILEATFDPRCFKCMHVIEMHELVAHAKDQASDMKSGPNTPKYPLILIDREGERYQVLFKLTQLRSYWVKVIGEQSSVSRAVAASPSSATPFSSKAAQSSSSRLRAQTTTSSTVSVSPQPFAAHPGVSRPPPFMRNERSTPGLGSMGGGRSNAVTTGGFDITQLRPNPPMTPSELILCSRQSSESAKSPKVSRKKSNRKSEKIRAEELVELNARKTLDCRSFDHDAKIFEVIEAYCQSSQNRMTLHSGLTFQMTSQPPSTISRVLDPVPLIITPRSTSNPKFSPKQRLHKLKTHMTSRPLPVEQRNFKTPSNVDLCSPLSPGVDDLVEYRFPYSPKEQRKPTLANGVQNSPPKRHSLPAFKKAFLKQNPNIPNAKH